jgi:hypothetical protein
MATVRLSRRRIWHTNEESKLKSTASLRLSNFVLHKWNNSALKFTPPRFRFSQIWMHEFQIRRWFKAFLKFLMSLTWRRQEGGIKEILEDIEKTRNEMYWRRKELIFRTKEDYSFFSVPFIIYNFLAHIYCLPVSLNFPLSLCFLVLCCRCLEADFSMIQLAVFELVSLLV